MRYQMVDASVVVVQLTGDVLVIDKQGVTHPVKIGEHLPAGSMLILEGGAHVQLEPGDSSSAAQPPAMPEMPAIVPVGALNAQTGPGGISPLGAQGTNDIAAIQQAILQGIDPTLNLEATAAGGAPGAGGGGAGGSGNAGFVSVDRTGASILAAAGFDTSYSSSGLIAPPDPVAVAENNPPLAVNDAAVTDEDQPVTIKVLANDSDPDGDAIAVIGAPLAEHGVVTVNPDGSLTYQPESNYHGTDVITYTITDPSGLTSTAVVNITVNSVDDPILVPQSLELPAFNEADLAIGSNSIKAPLSFDGSFTLQALAGLASIGVGDRQLSLDSLRALLSQPVESMTFTTPRGNTLQLTGFDEATGTVSYRFTLVNNVEHLGANGERLLDALQLTVTDTEGDTAGVLLTIPVLDDVPRAVNDAPVTAEGTPVVLVEDGTLQSVSGNVLVNDLYPNGQPGADGRSFDGWADTPSSVLSQYGSLVLGANGSYSFALDSTLPATQALKEGETRSESFSYNIVDGDGDPATASLTITIQGSNDVPQLNVDPGNEGGNVQVFEAGLPQGSAAGDGSTLAYGSFSLGDADGLDDLQSVTLNGTAFAMADLVGAVVVGAHGSLTVTGYDSTTGVASYRYELTSATTDGAGAESEVFTLSVSDGSASSSPATITVDIIDDVPQAVADSNSVSEDGEVLTVSGGVLTNDLHDNGQPGADVPVSFIEWVAPQAQYGSFTDLGNGQYQYTLDNSLAAVQGLDEGQTLTEQFSYRMQDADGDPSTAMLTITINGSNDVPQLNVDPGNEGGNDQVFEAGLPQGSAAGDGSTLAYGSFSLGDADGLDDLQSVTLNGTAFAMADLVGAVVVGAHGSLTVTGYDSTTGVASYRYELTSATTDGAGAESEVFTLSVSDGSASSSPATITVDIIDDVPQAVADSNSVSEDGEVLTVSGGVLANDLHDNGQPGADVPVSFIGWVAPQAQYGSFTDLGNGQYQYTLDNSLAAVQGLDEGQTLTEQFSYRMQDADGDPSTAMLTITINGSNDVPQLNVDPGNEGGNVQVFEAGLPQGSAAGDGSTLAYGSFSLGDADGLDDLQSVTLNGTAFAMADLVGAVVVGAHGSLTVTGYDSTTGVASYRYELTSATTDGAGAESEVFTLSVSDGSASSSPATITVDIIDDVPQAVADSNSVSEDGEVLTVSGGVLTNDLHDNGQPGADVPVSFIEWVAPQAQYGSFTDLGNGQYQYTLDNSLAAVQGLDEGQTLTEQFSYRMQDADGDPSTAMLTITINGSNDVPQLNVDPGNEGGNVQVFEAGLPQGSAAGDGSTLAYGSFSLGDADGLDDLQSVTLNGTAFAMADLVGAVVVGAHGSLTVTGYDSTTGVASYRYELTSATTDGAGAESEVFTLSVSDGSASSSPATITVDIIDDVPQAVADSNSVSEDGEVLTVSGGVLTNDLHDNGQPGADVPVSFIEWVAPQAQYGSFTDLGNGQYQYTLDNSLAAVQGLDEGQTLTEQFSYRMQDADGDPSTAMLTITINGSNDVPQLNVDPGNEGGNVQVFEAGLPQGSAAGDGSTLAYGSFSLGDADGLDDLQSVTLNGTAFAMADLVGAVVVGAHGSLTVTGYDSTTGVASYRYELTSATTDGAGAESEVFTLSVSDGSASSSPATITVDIIDDVPQAVADSNSVSEDGEVLTVSGGVLANDLHDNGQPGADVPVSFIEWVAPQAQYGSFTDLGNGQYQYTLDNSLAAVQGLDEGQTLTEQFSYRMQDADGDPSTAMLTITINGSNDVPQLNVDPGNEGGNVQVFEAGLPQGSAAGDGSTLAYGSFSLGDADGLDDLQSVTLNGTAFAMADLVGAVVVGAHGSLTVTGYDSTTGVASYRYELTSATTDGAGAESEVFTLSVSDGSASSSPATITVDIIDDVPQAVADSNSVSEDGEVLTVSGGVLANDLHDNGQPGADVPVSFIEWVAPQAQYGSFTDLGNGQYQYTLDNSLAAVQGLDEGQTLTEQFSYRMQDADGDPSTAMLTITINGSDDAMNAADDTDSFSEDAVQNAVTGNINVLTNDTDPDTSDKPLQVSDTATQLLFLLNPDGTLSGTSVGSITFTSAGSYTLELSDSYKALANALDVGETMKVGAEYTAINQDNVTDDAVLRVTITGSNDAPSISVAGEGLTVFEAGLPSGSNAASNSESASGQFTVGDADGLDDITSITVGSSTLTVGVGGLAGLVSSTVDTGYGSLQLTRYSNGTFSYKYTLIDPVDNDSKPGADTNGYIETVALSVSDGTSSANTSFGVYITDDVPNATNIVQSEQATSAINTNLLITLDISGSMGESANYGGLTRLEAAKQSIVELLEQYEVQGNVKVKIVTFSDNGATLGTTWQTITEAKVSLLTLSPQNMTNYDDALTDTMTAFAQTGKLTGAQNVAYFLSDGQPNRPSGSPGINTTEEQAWTKFVNDNDIRAYALGMGTGSVASALDPIAYDGTGSGTNTNSHIITDLSQLTSTLVTMAHASPLNGVLTSGGTFGADGGHVDSIVVGGITYTFDGSAMSDSDGGTLNNATYDAVTHLLTVTTAAAGKIAVDMDNGVYQYSPPSTVTTLLQEQIGFTLIDHDGDRDSAFLQITVDPAASPLVIRDDLVVTNVNAADGNDAIVIPEWALLANDTGDNSSRLDISSVANAVGGSIVNGSIDVTFTESSPTDVNGGSFTYTAAIGSTILSDVIDVSIDRSQRGEANLDGSFLNEILLGRDGTSDTINGNGGDDILIGLGGNDILNGGYGDDILDGGAGNDTLNGGNGVDTATYIDSTAAVSVSLALGGQDTLGAGTDTLSNIENLIGSNFADTLTGNSSANVIVGGAGNDTISGGGGDDTLRGGLGADILTGGSGADVFKFMMADKDGNTDTIKDFTLNQDKLDLSEVLNDPTGSLSDYLSVTGSGDNAMVKVYSAGNASGGGTPDLTIILDGLSSDLQDLQDYLHDNGVIK